MVARELAPRPEASAHSFSRKPGPGLGSPLPHCSEQATASVLPPFSQTKAGAGPRPRGRTEGRGSERFVRSGPPPAASNLIGRLAEATNPVTSIVGSAGTRRHLRPARVSDRRLRFSSLSPFTLPPTRGSFIETRAPRAGPRAERGRGGAGRPRTRERAGSTLLPPWT